MNIEKEYIKFLSYYLGTESYPETKVEVTIGTDANLDEVLLKFEDFLRATGYCFNGTLAILDDTIENYDKEN